MDSKARPSSRELTASPAAIIAKSSQTLFGGHKLRGTEPLSHEVLRDVDAVWLFESAPDAMVLVDGQGRIAAANAQAEKMFGFLREELVGEPVERLIPQRFREGHIGHRSEYEGAPRARPMGADLELYGLRKDGSEFPIEISLSPLETNKGVLVSSAIRDVTELKRTKELQSRLEFESVMSRLSKTLISLPADRIDREVHEGLQSLAEVLDLDRIVIHMADPDKKRRVITHAWSRPGVPAVALGEAKNEFCWLVNRIANNQTCCVSTTDELPAEAADEREYMLNLGMKSWLVIPLLVGGEHIGGISAGMFRRSREWDSHLLSRFQQAAEVFANALARQRAAQALRESMDQTQLALDSAKLGVWGWTVGREEFWASVQTRDLFGWPIDFKLDLAALLDSVHPEDRENVRRMLDQAMREPAEHHAEFRILRPDGSVRWIRSLGRSYWGAQGAPEQIIGASLDVTDRKRDEEALASQLSFETQLTELSATFINLLPGQMDAHITEAQKRICESLGLDRSTLAQVTLGGDDVVITHSWVREGFQATPSISKRNLPWVAQMVFGGRRVCFARIDDLPEEAAKDRETFLEFGPKSSVIFPLSAGGSVLGALAFGALREERNWPAPLLGQLGLMAQVFANALARAQGDQSLQKAYAEIQQLKGRLEKENVYLRQEIKLDHHHNRVIGESEGIRSVLKKAEQVAATDATVLLLGETGTGKELIAHAIHELSRRKGRVMVKVNCAALPSSLVESELFGRERGAYTGALTREIGRFELADGSTILLDEIGELPLELQSKLLRVLQEGEFERLGSPRTIRVDVRVIAATSRDLQRAVREGKFREDLFYRLNIFPIMIPALRERPEDIPALTWHFVSELGQRMGRSTESIHGSTMEAFKKYPWPGNVRELRNIIERFLITSTDSVFRAELQSLETSGPAMQTQTFESVERNHIQQILETVNWRVRGEGGAAQILGLKPTTLESRMQRLGIVRRK
jgi:formate hydrogenlyase transcriptional activator